MPQMTNSSARVIDPILSAVARGYKQNAFVGAMLFPRVPVTSRGGKVLTFGKEDFMLYPTQRVPGQNTRRIQVGYTGASYTLEDHSLEGQVPIETMEEAEAVPGIDMASTSIRKVQGVIAMRLEKAQADMARTAASYAAANKTTLSSTSQWSDLTSGVSDPVNDIEVGKEAVRAKIGRRPNTAVIGAAVFAKLKQHPKIIDRIKYTGREIATPALLASLFDLQNVFIGDSVYASDAGVFADIWGKDVVLAYTETSGIADMGVPSYGYTYQLEGYPVVEEPYYDHNAKSWIYPVTDVCAPTLPGAEAGYLIVNAVA